LVYLAVQQSLRQGANDPQIQMAEDAATQLQTSTSTENVIPSGVVNINQSLAPYLVIYDAAGNPIAGNGLLNGMLPGLPAGVFSYTRANGEDRFTWQPAAEIRQAVVIVEVPNGDGEFAMAARSLREVEVREKHAGLEAGVACLFAIGVLLLLEIVFAVIESHRL